MGVASPEALRGATPSLLACPRKGKVRPANPVRGATRSCKIGGRQGVDTLNPKLLDIRVVKGWATGSRQLGSAE